jgi:gas vesicle protein
MDKMHLCTFLTGLSIGAGMALLFAPQSGKKTRNRIAEAAAEGAAYAKEYGETVRDTTLDVIGRGKDAISEGRKLGAQAYKEAVS